MEEIIQLTKELIRFESMHSKPEEIQRCAQFIENYLKNCGAHYRRLDHKNVPSIIVLPRESFAPILLMTHIDVVAAPDKLFKPVEKDGKLYGRGSLDDKYGVALSLVLLKEWLQQFRKQNKTQKDLPFGILITGDEEVGGLNGAKKALEEIKTNFCIALDGGNLDKIVLKEKGVVKLKLVSRGRAAHGARPWLGENAIEKLIEDTLKLKTFFEQTAPDHWHRTMNLGIFQAGKSPNQVPDYAEAYLDIRYTENDDIDELIERMRRTVSSKMVVEMKEPLFESGESLYLDLLLDISKGTTIGFEHGASDARFLSEHGIKGIVWGASGDHQHSLEEYVKIESVYKLYSILDEFMTKL
jgi:succinyl-diaminopimelate desuccinylase